MNEEKASGQAVAALVVGILSIIFIPLLGPVAIWLGHTENKAIREGSSSAAGQGFATAGLVMGIVGSCFLISR